MYIEKRVVRPVCCLRDCGQHEPSLCSSFVLFNNTHFDILVAQSLSEHKCFTCRIHFTITGEGSGSRAGDPRLGKGAVSLSYRPTDTKPANLFTRRDF